MSPLPPREKGSSTHETWDANCRLRAEDEVVVPGVTCPVCAESRRTVARYFLDQAAPRELGS